MLSSKLKVILSSHVDALYNAKVISHEELAQFHHLTEREEKPLNLNPIEPLRTRRDVSEFMKISLRQVDRLAEANLITKRRIGKRSVRFTFGDITKFAGIRAEDGGSK